MRKLIIFYSLALLLAACTAAGNDRTANQPAAQASDQPQISQASLDAATAAAQPAGPVTEEAMKITSPAFDDGKPIPKKFTCQGENVSPTLTWSGIPAGTKSLALVTEDPDAPSGIFIHWVLYNMQPGLSGLPEKVQAAPQVAGTGTQGSSGFGRPGYGGPCPPPGKAHRYYFKLYALDLDPQLPAGLNAAGLQKQMAGHILAQAQWMGTFQR